MYRKYKLLRMIAYTIEILILYILQETPSIFGVVTGVKPILVISAAVTISIFENQNIGMALGILSGFLMDVGYSGVIGVNTMIMSVLCYVVGLLAVNYIRTNIITAFICTTVISAITLTLNYFLIYVLSKYGSNAYAYNYHYLPIMIYSILPLPILYFINKSFNIWINERS